MTSISFKVSSSCFANAVGLGGASFSAGGASFSAGGALFSVGGASFSAGWASFSVGCMNGTMAPCCSRCFFRSASSSLSWGSPWRHKSYSYHTVSASSPPQPQSSELGCTDSVLGTSCGVGDFLPSTRLAGTSVSCFERSELALPRFKTGIGLAGVEELLGSATSASVVFPRLDFVLGSAVTWLGSATLASAVFPRLDLGGLAGSALGSALVAWRTCLLWLPSFVPVWGESRWLPLLCWAEPLV